MKKYALLIALAIAPSLAHDNLDIEGIKNVPTKPILAMHTEPHHTPSPITSEKDPFDEKNEPYDKDTNQENLEKLITEAEKTIAKLEAIKDGNSADKNHETSQDEEHPKLAFNKWSNLSPNLGANYISGGSSGGSSNGSGSSGGGSSGGASGGGSSGNSKTASNGNNPSGDNGGVVASAVPEPEIYLMFLAGLGLIGYNAKKRVAKR